MCVDRATAPTRIVLPNYVPANVVATCSRWRVRRDTREEGKERKESHSCRLCTSNRTDEYVRHATVAPPAMDPPGITALVSHECPWTTQPVRTSAAAAYSQLLDSAVPRRHVSRFLSVGGALERTRTKMDDAPRVSMLETWLMDTV